LKKPTGSVRFLSLKPKKPNRIEPKLKKSRNKTEPNRKNQAKTEPNRKTRAKPEKTEPNRFELVFVLKKPNRIEIGRFEPVSVFFFNFGLVTFFRKKKTEPNRK